MDLSDRLKKNHSKTAATADNKGVLNGPGPVAGGDGVSEAVKRFMATTYVLNMSFYSQLPDVRESSQKAGQDGRKGAAPPGAGGRRMS